MAIFELSKYVSEQLVNGASSKQIRRALLKAGWNSTDVESSLTLLELSHSSNTGLPRSFNLKKSELLSGTKRLLPKVGKEGAMAALLTAPLLAIPFLAGLQIYREFWWQLILATFGGGLFATAHSVILRRLVTPALDPKRIRLRWLAASPPLVLLLLWLIHLPLITASALALMMGLLACAIISKAFVFDALASSVGFGCLYLFLLIILKIPVTGPIELISSFSGTTFLSYPIKDLGLVFVFGAMWGPIYTAFRKIMPLPKVEGYHSGHQLSRRPIIAILVLMFFAGAYGTYSQFIRTPVALAASPANGTKLTDLTSPITITFDKPIDRNLLKLSISPAVSGDLSFSDPYMQRTLDRKVTFTPQSHLSPDTTYTVHVANIQNVLGRQAGTLQFTFRTPSLPAVASISIRNEQKNVAICDPVTVILNQPANKLEAFNFKLSPTIPITATLGQDSRTFTLIPKDCLSQNTSYTFTVQRRLTVYNETGRLINSTEPYVTLEAIAFTTKAAPGISGFTPQGEGILSSIKQFEVLFSEPMDISDSTSGLSVQPAVSGTWNWLNSRTLRYDLSGSLQLDTAYTITVPHGFKDARNGFLVRDTLFSFRTLGHMQIVSISPKSSSGNVAINTPIRISFDQPVDQNSAQQNFSINPAVSGSFSWQGQTMLYSATLSKDSSYQIIEKAGVVSQIGLPSQAAISTSFQTEESVLLLNIPVYYQQKPLSCEVASLKMALNYKGSSISEAALFNGLGNDTTPRQGDTWGDPYQFFVGDANGHQNTTGYGVYAGPIAAIGSQYRSAQSLSGMSTSQVAGYLAQGNPVIFWGTAGNAKPDQWTTTGGRQINGWIGEHVRLLVGFNGPASHPTAFTINDPIFGRLKWTASQLQANWSAFNGMGVVIF